jgi:hypothetical protein
LQADLHDGAMYIFTHAEADHAASVTHSAEFKNGRVRMRFKLEDERDSLGLNFADLQSKTCCYRGGESLSQADGIELHAAEPSCTGDISSDLVQDRIQFSNFAVRAAGGQRMNRGAFR